MKRPLSMAARPAQGVVLVVTLIVLVALTLASLALVRSVDTSAMIAGNLAFKQSAAISADGGVEAAIKWVRDNNATLTDDNPSSGYYATRQDKLDLTGGQSPDNPDDDLDWGDDGQVSMLPKDSVGNQVSYVVHRMCNKPGKLDSNTCSTEESEVEGSSEGARLQMENYKPGGWDIVANRGLYRITVRVTGPRFNVAYAQTVISQ
ncbi:hypothetical protein [Pseudoduganella sp.]|uniref:pilus assembly PilX family protein n=1 Tax=Pseudoduganella sp. TaxID=1880898 RepID=UPI0035AE1B19